MSTANPRPSIAELPRYETKERRVLGVMIEKGKTTPDYYPMTLAGLITGCNQKSNRDPVVAYDEDDVEDTLVDLRAKHSVIKIEGLGRVPKWKHNLYELWGVSKAEIAVLAELLLRGPQTEGELRARAERMENTLEDQDALHQVLEPLRERGMVLTLSPPGRKRGVVVCHGFYPEAELEALKAKHSGGGDDDYEAPQAAERAAGVAPPARTELKAEFNELKDTVQALSARLTALESQLADLRRDLGA